MLKFFRIYQKYILAIGAVILMIAFLIPQATQMLTPSRAGMVIGRVDGEKFRQGDIETAAAEMQVLSAINPLTTLLYDQDPTTWALAVREAERLGLSAGPAEVAQLLATLQVDDAAQHRLAASMHTNVAFVRNAMRHWIMVETYRGLALGETRTTPLERLTGAMQIAQSYGAQAFPQMANYLGQPRLSAPILTRVIVDQESSVSGKLLVVPADKAVTDAPEPTEAELQALFEQHKDRFPGGESGLGYRIEPRVKLEYLSIPYEAVLNTVDADEVEAIALYERDPSRFKDAAGKTRDYAAARQDVVKQLRDDKAQAKIDLMVRRARAILQEAPEFRHLPEQNGYKVLPEGYAPLSLRVVADKIEEEFGVRPVVRFHRDAWLSVRELITLEGLGLSSLADRGGVFFADYLLSAKEMDPPAENPLTGLRLQVNVVSQPMRSTDGSRQLFRLVAAEPDHAPANLDAVRDKVVADARRLAAFERLKAQADDWRQKAVEQGLDALADSMNLNVLDLPALRRVGATERNVPNVPGIGADAGFIRAVYARADELLAQDKPLNELPEAERIVAATVESRAALAIVQLNDYKPISESDYHRLAASPQLQGMVGFALVSEELPDPLSYDTLAKVTHYVPAYPRDDKTASDEADAAQP